MTIEELRENLITLNEQANAIRGSADEEKRDITDDEQADLNKLLNAYDASEQDLEQRERLEQQN